LPDKQSLGKDLSNEIINDFKKAADLGNEEARQNLKNF